jgi:hypothetical protein
MRNVIILFLYLFVSCNTENKKEVKREQTYKLEKTKWICKIADNCTNYYEFKTKNSFIFYSCEMEDEYFGNYYFKGDTLVIDQKGSVYDKDLPKESIHKTERKQYKLLIKDNKLKHLFMSDWVNEKWIKSDFKFDGSYR